MDHRVVDTASANAVGNNCNLRNLKALYVTALAPQPGGSLRRYQLNSGLERCPHPVEWLDLVINDLHE